MHNYQRNNVVTESYLAKAKSVHISTNQSTQ